ncbi:MAG: YHS domain-containing protein [Acidobacteria bacterium]|nr:YHS domain-containing protein [Acidobacteriota bacterium]
MMLLSSITPVFVDLARGLHEGFFMFWETLWALVLGFTLSGAVQAFVSKDQMRAKFGDHRPAAVARASGYGMVSSSCSYAASAMSKSLFAKGADFTSSMIFMFASTNLVVELGVVMLVLLGWQFAAAEFVGGPIMIVLLAFAGGIVFAGPVLQRALARVRGEEHGGHDHQAMVGVTNERQEELESQPLGTKIRSAAAWSDASSYAVADVTMLRRELVIGYVAAGLIATIVPTWLWNDLFIHGHGFWTDLENALVGPLIAVVSWVCSIGNVPLAAALWSGGISFGGVIAFIFADLISMPLILIYRKLYGGRLTLRMVGLFYVVMAIAGLITQWIFSGLGAIPSRRTFNISAAHFEWNYTTYLNFVFIVVALGVWWLARHRQRFGGGVGYAIDPVCGMQVRTIDAPARSTYEGHDYYFCADRCREKFEEEPMRYTKNPHASMASMSDHVMSGGETPFIDPVCGMSVDPATAAALRSFNGRNAFFCSAGCAERFDEDPERFLAPDAVLEGMPAPAHDRQTSFVDPVCGMSVDPASAAARRSINGRDVFFCSAGCAERFDEDPERFLAPDAVLEGMPAPAHDRQTSFVDPVCGMSVDPASAAARRSINGRDVFFCSAGCAERFDEDPERFLAPDAVPEGMPASAVNVAMGKKPTSKG